MQPTITVDVGTTSVKLCVFDDAGQLKDVARVPTPTVSDAWGEIYDVKSLIGSIGGFIRDLSGTRRESITRIAFTGVGESGGLVRSDMTLASPMILWHDHRGSAELEKLSDDDRVRLYAVTGLPSNANYGLSKIAWAVKNSDGPLADAQWLNVSEYLAAFMTGQRWSEYSLASRTMALDLTSRDWSEEVASLLGVDVSVLPDLRAASDGSPILRDIAEDLGLNPDLIVHVAGHDHIVGAVGAQLRAGELLNSTGTTEGLLFIGDKPSLTAQSSAAKLANGVSCTADDFTLFASIPTGGSAFATLQSLLGVGADELSTLIDDLHDRYVAYSIDLDSIPLVLPQFRGSPPPTKNAAARGIVADLGSKSTLEDFVFGTFLGMTLQFRDVLELFPTPASRIKVIGPASKNRLWLQLKADLLNTRISASEFPEVVSSGAQALASAESPVWADTHPFDVDPDIRRHRQLNTWVDQHRPLWEYLKAAPA
ncbi:MULTISPECIES: L-fuculokinase [unclassified Frondihabitans]|uniref:FGGY-family carbohydrate kinase n=1 Tax=unclassified Frondihabitans TaxID=2626248 RepID=UPI000F4D66C8|nr:MULTISPECIES: FGGY family carbohydrate kinase [unclassified Frondihabitans]RPE77845.1 sugar (pentulose or hexulose) kinase [Frondihabitans sp. PhB153]RPF08124.1 sugar (pentulose or hexulose) kinase [Frondihabitans sp. PhB161]